MGMSCSEVFENTILMNSTVLGRAKLLPSRLRLNSGSTSVLRSHVSQCPTMSHFENRFLSFPLSRKGRGDQTRTMALPPLHCRTGNEVK
jgi:hypothetical protein